MCGCILRTHGGLESSTPSLGIVTQQPACERKCSGLPLVPAWRLGQSSSITASKPMVRISGSIPPISSAVDQAAVPRSPTSPTCCKSNREFEDAMAAATHMTTHETTHPNQVLPGQGHTRNTNDPRFPKKNQGRPNLSRLVVPPRGVEPRLSD